MEEDPELDKIIEKSGNSEVIIDAAKKIKSVFCNIEKKIVDGENPNIIEGAYLGEVYSAIVEEPSAYVVPLIKWSLTRLAKTIDNALKQRTLSEFYDKIPHNCPFSCAILGVPKKLDLKAFIKEKDDFYVQTIGWPSLSIAQYDKIEATTLEGKALIIQGEREPWKKDYRALVDRIEKEGKNYSVMLFHLPAAVSNSERIKITTGVFLTVFAHYRKIE